MAVLEIVQSNLVNGAPGWISAGTSKGNINAGAEYNPHAKDLVSDPATTAVKLVRES